MLAEIVPTLRSDAAAARRFAAEVLDRFRNPFIEHELVKITLQQTMKMGVRVAPSVRAFVQRFGRVPQGLALGVAAYLISITGPDPAARAAPGRPPSRIRTRCRMSALRRFGYTSDSFRIGSSRRLSGRSSRRRASGKARSPASPAFRKPSLSG